jgi:hypothetical protein
MYEWCSSSNKFSILGALSIFASIETSRESILLSILANLTALEAIYLERAVLFRAISHLEIYERHLESQFTLKGLNFMASSNIYLACS